MYEFRPFQGYPHPNPLPEGEGINPFVIFFPGLTPWAILMKRRWRSKAALQTGKQLRINAIRRSEKVLSGRVSLFVPPPMTEPWLRGNVWGFAVTQGQFHIVGSRS